MNKTSQAHLIYVEHTAVNKAMAERLEKLLPVGTRVSWLTYRGSDTYRQFGRITGHCSWWSNPCCVAVRNDATDKITRQGVGSKGFLVEE